MASLLTSIPAVHYVPLALVDSIEQVAMMIVFGVVGLLAIIVSFLRVQAMFGSGESTAHEQLINCQWCGARITAEADECEHCGEPINQ